MYIVCCTTTPIVCLVLSLHPLPCVPYSVPPSLHALHQHLPPSPPAMDCSTPSLPPHHLQICFYIFTFDNNRHEDNEDTKIRQNQSPRSLTSDTTHFTPSTSHFSTYNLVCQCCVCLCCNVIECTHSPFTVLSDICCVCACVCVCLCPSVMPCYMFPGYK